MESEHGVVDRVQEWRERAAERYLRILRDALLDLHYPENELRIGHLAECVTRGREPELRKLRDPVRYMKEELARLTALRRTGAPDAKQSELGYFPYAQMGAVRLDHLWRCLDRVRHDAVPGDLVECGTRRGGGAIFLRGYLAAHEITDRTVWVADPFRASPRTGAPVPRRRRRRTTLAGGPGFPELRADLNTVRDGFHRFGLLDGQVRFLQGPYAATLPGAPVERIALLRVGDDEAAADPAVLEALYPLLAEGGFVVVDTYSSPASRAAVDGFRARHGIEDRIERVDAHGICWRKGDGRTGRPATPAPAAGLHAPLAPRRAPTLDLSVVVVFYNMRREAQRTLHSLSRAYQRDIEHRTYEVIVVENGSRDDQRLGDEFVTSFGPEFRYLDLGPDARPSPAHALNRGIEVSRGAAVALMIDGAHVLSPGVLRYGLLALEAYAPAVVATQPWYLGPGQQSETMTSGYDQAYEDRLLERIGWPDDGYRLFEIGHFASDRDWFDGMWESNCIFVPRAVLEQVGGFDESFSMAGGGYANLEFYERVGATPGVTLATILGEASFHQVHGGTTTNQADPDERRRRIAGYADHYRELRGRPFRGPGRAIHYVGFMHPAARRTKARRLASPGVFDAGAPDTEGLPAQPVPVPEDLRVAFTDAFWRGLAWQTTTWLGRVVGRPPADLFVYQELIAQTRPDWVIETGTGTGGRAHFLATVCDLLGHGRVVTIGRGGSPPEHPRLVHVARDPLGPHTLDEVRRIVGEVPNALVVIGTRANNTQTLRQFERYAPFVPVGSYVVVEDTIVNGHPVWPGFGPGPAEAIKAIMNTRGDFAPDPGCERYGLTFNPGGFLKRIR
ncbi:MAG: hypothetical protein KatS3mg009_1799 [Acidimicrobiia bacterium]|nr:MAG: hypothetical protein KatS3mg009_1799 [Acidimicrobiia bacterium]